LKGKTSVDNKDSGRVQSRDMFHTQECRAKKLTEPRKCIDDNAWLGAGYYFWYDKLDAIKWGEDFKTKTGSYEIYIATIDFSEILDTVFDEEHYKYWLKWINSARKKLAKKMSNPTLKEVNEYLLEMLNEFDGVMYQDLPTNLFSSVLPIAGSKQSFVYRKRIQLVLYNIDKMELFELHEHHLV